MSGTGGEKAVQFNQIQDGCLPQSCLCLCFSQEIQYCCSNSWYVSFNSRGEAVRVGYLTVQCTPSSRLFDNHNGKLQSLTEGIVRCDVAHPAWPEVDWCHYCCYCPRYGNCLLFVVVIGFHFQRVSGPTWCHLINWCFNFRLWLVQMQLNWLMQHHEKLFYFSYST